MIALPEGFDLGEFISELFYISGPFIGIAFLVSVGVFLRRMAKRVGR